MTNPLSQHTRTGLVAPRSRAHRTKIESRHPLLPIPASPLTTKMADTPVTLRTRKFIRNPLLARKQMVV
jgi:hypothetical protein